jgi:hypothetical protein
MAGESGSHGGGAWFPAAIGIIEDLHPQRFERSRQIVNQISPLSIIVDRQNWPLSSVSG